MITDDSMLCVMTSNRAHVQKLDEKENETEVIAHLILTITADGLYTLTESHYGPPEMQTDADERASGLAKRRQGVLIALAEMQFRWAAE